MALKRYNKYCDSVLLSKIASEEIWRTTQNENIVKKLGRNGVTNI